jgi:hypothetical protein
MRRLFRNGIDIQIPDSKIIKSITTADISDFTSIVDSDFSLSEGVLIQNINSSGDILVKHNSTSHDTKSGYLLSPGKSLFVECGNLKDVQVVNQTKTGAVSIQIVGA